MCIIELVIGYFCVLDLLYNACDAGDQPSTIVIDGVVDQLKE